MDRTTLAHPTWCDPRLCRTFPSNLIHRSAPTAWDLGTDMRVAVGLTRSDEIGAFENTGVPVVTLGLADTESVTEHGEPIDVDAWLDAPNARLLAAALITVAEQLEAVQAVTR